MEYMYISPEPATISLTSSPSFSIMDGDTVTLTCFVTLPSGVTDTPLFQWEGSGVVTDTPNFQWEGSSGVSSTSMTNGSTVSSDLTLDGISTSQAGEYTCNATLSGSITDSINITVQSKRCNLCSIHCTLHITCSLVQTPTPFISSNSNSLIAGTPLNLSCDYTLSTSVDTDITATATWTINDMPLKISESGISTDGVYLIFSPLTTSYTGNYICALTITPSSETPHVTVGGPVKSSVKVIIVQSIVHSIFHVIV